MHWGLILQTKTYSITARVLLASACVTAVLTTLTACLPLAATGALIGATVSVDRRTVGTQIDDQAIQLRANQRIKEVLPGDDKGYAYVTSHNRRVLLTGLAPDARSKARAEQIAASVDNVRGVYNELNIGSPSLLTEGKAKRQCRELSLHLSTLAECALADRAGDPVVTECFTRLQWVPRNRRACDRRSDGMMT